MYRVRVYPSLEFDFLPYQTYTLVTKPIVFGLKCAFVGRLSAPFLQTITLYKIIFFFSCLSRMILKEQYSFDKKGSISLFYRNGSQTIYTSLLLIVSVEKISEKGSSIYFVLLMFLILQICPSFLCNLALSLNQTVSRKETISTSNVSFNQDLQHHALNGSSM